MAHAQLNKQSGFTLIEFLIATVIILVGMLGLLQSVNVALSSNRQNQMRNDAGLVMDKWLATELGRPFSNLSTTTPAGAFVPYGVDSRPVLSGYANFSVARDVKLYNNSPNSKEVNLEVSWHFRGTRTTYRGGGLVSNNPVTQ